MSASRASQKGDCLPHENGTVNFILAINSEQSQNSFENLYCRDMTSDCLSGCVADFFRGGGGGGGWLCDTK